MNPIEVLYCWQAVLIACAAVALTQLTKTIIDIRRGQKAPTETMTLKDAAAVGKLLRKTEGSVWLNRVVIPGLAVFYGTVLAILVPARPEVLVEYIAAHSIGWTAYFIYAAWGSACGQFADYIFTKIKDLLSAAMKRPSSEE